MLIHFPLHVLFNMFQVNVFFVPRAGRVPEDLPGPREYREETDVMDGMLQNRMEVTFKSIPHLKSISPNN